MKDKKKAKKENSAGLQSNETSYEALKEITRNNKGVTKADIEGFIENLDLDESVKKELKNLTPFNYTGLS